MSPGPAKALAHLEAKTKHRAWKKEQVRQEAHLKARVKERKAIRSHAKKTLRKIWRKLI